MDDTRFDWLAKSVGSSRRGVVKTAAGGALALAMSAAVGRGASAAVRKRPAGSVCVKNADCASNYCSPADSAGRRHCSNEAFHSFSLNGFSCPTGATGFTYSGTLDPESATQAQQACEQCYGHACELSDLDCAGLGYCPGPPNYDGQACFGYNNGCSGDDGRIWLHGMSYTTYGYWGK